MSDHGTHHASDHSGEPKSKTAFRSSFWFVIILVGLFIAALNFINVMGHSEGHEAHEATTTGMHHGETGSGHEQATDTAMHHGAATAHDTADHEGHH